MRVGPSAGACGAAIWRGKQVVVRDAATDPMFADYRPVVQQLGLGGCVASPIKSSGGRVLGSFALHYRDVCEPQAWHLRLIELCLHLCALALEREQTKARVHQLAFYDSLTGLPNRVMFSARAEQALAAAEYHAFPVAILFVDIDRFKRVNETQGHAAGDGMLRDIARRLGETLSATDLIGRQAGDEFVLMLPQCGAEQAAGVAERLLLALAEECGLIDELGHWVLRQACRQMADWRLRGCRYRAWRSTCRPATSPTRSCRRAWRRC